MLPVRKHNRCNIQFLRFCPMLEEKYMLTLATCCAVYRWGMCYSTGPRANPHIPLCCQKPGRAFVLLLGNLVHKYKAMHFKGFLQKCTNHQARKKGFLFTDISLTNSINL